MSANTVIGTDVETASKLDTFWGNLSLEARACLHTAFNFSQKKRGYASLKNPEEILANAESGRGTISNVRSDFFNFLGKNIEDNPTASSMLQEILHYGELSAEEQEIYFS